MGPAVILIARGRVPALLAAALLVIAALDAPAAEPAAEPQAGERKQDADIERYRELSLALMVAAGASRDWAERLAPRGAAAERPSPAGGSLAPPVPVRNLETPLQQIAGQRQAIADAAQIFRFAFDHEPDIEAELARLAAQHPDGIVALDAAALAEDALLIRSALTSGIEYLGRLAEPGWLDGLDSYREQTVFLRNMLEYWDFERELAALTADALRDTGTRMEAYERLLEVDPRFDAFTQHLRAVQLIYRQYGSKAEAPEDPSDELIEAASQVD